MTDTPTDRPTVFYNGACPICSAEIAHYRALPNDLDWVDVRAEPDRAAPWLDADSAIRRLHTLTVDGRLLAGVDAFIAMWERIPRYRLAAKIVRLPVIRQIGIAVYEGVLAPLLYRWNKRREARAGMHGAG